MIPFEQALELIEQTCRPLSPIQVDLPDAVGCCLSEDVHADSDIPPFSKSLVDGYAICTGPEKTGRQEMPVIDVVPAGSNSTKTLGSNDAIKIMTGAPIPAGANAVVMVEDVDNLDEQRIAVNFDHVQLGQMILNQAHVAERNQTVVARGTLLKPQHIGILAETGCAQPSVIAPPSVSILTTGNEIVPMDQHPAPSQIRNSNAALLQTMANRISRTVDYLGHAQDDQAELTSKLEVGLQADVLVVTGGVSAGDFDLIPRVLAELGVDNVFHKVNLKPGKPVWFGCREQDQKRSYVFGLPGNPVSSLVCFELLTKTAIRAIAGIQNPRPRLTPATLECEFTNRGNRLLFQPSFFCQETRQVKPLEWKGSADQLSVAQSNCLTRFEAASTMQAGDRVDVCLFE